MLVKAREDALDRITLHECRHAYASLMIAAGVNAKALSTYMGHANISITLDRYGHLMPGNEDEAAGLLDSFLERAAAEQARSATVEGDGRVIGAQIVAAGAQEGPARPVETAGARTGAQGAESGEIPANIA